MLIIVSFTNNWVWLPKIGNLRYKFVGKIPDSIHISNFKTANNCVQLISPKITSS